MRKLSISILFILMTLGLFGCGPVNTVLSTATPELLLLATPEASYPNPPSYPNTPSYPNPSGDDFPQLTGDWHIRLTQTGGIAGVSRKLEISSDGKMTVSDERTKKQDS